MSSRVGQLAAGMASLLDIKPVMTIQDGKLEMLEKVRTKKKSWRQTIELMNQAIAGQSIERMAIAHAAVPEAAVEFESLLRASQVCPDEIMMVELTPGLSVHSGAGLVRVGFMVK